MSGAPSHERALIRLEELPVRIEIRVGIEIGTARAELLCKNQKEEANRKTN